MAPIVCKRLLPLQLHGGPNVSVACLGQSMRFFKRSGRMMSIPGVVRVGEKRIEALQTLGTRRPGLTRAGRLSLAGVCDGQRVKVYSAHSKRQIALRIALQNACEGTLKFPAVIAHDDHLVVEQWVSGVTIANAKKQGRDLASSAAQQFIQESYDNPRLHALATEFSDAFCYFEHYLLQRIGPWLHWDHVQEFVESWMTDYSRLKPVIPVRISHPDLSQDNIVLEDETHELYVVDNELLGSGRGWVLDARNSLLRRRGASTDPFPHDGIPESFIEASWKLRQLGKHLNLGKLDHAYAILKSVGLGDRA